MFSFYRSFTPKNYMAPALILCLCAGLMSPGINDAMAAGSEASGVTFYASFEDESPESLGAEAEDWAVRQGELDFAEGIRGQALRAGYRQGFLVYSNERILDHKRGSIEFWFRAEDWEIGHRSHHALFETIGSGWLLIYKYIYLKQLFLLNSENKETWSILRAPMEEMDVQQWQHVVCTWETSEAKFFLNGQLVGTLSYPQLSHEPFEGFMVGDRKTLGTDPPPGEKEDVHTLLDELYIYDRPLTETEVQWAYEHAGKRERGADIPREYGVAGAVTAYPSPSSQRIEVKVWVDKRWKKHVKKVEAMLEPSAEVSPVKVNFDGDQGSATLHFEQLPPDDYVAQVRLSMKDGEPVILESEPIKVRPAPWLDNDLGKSDAPPEPWTPVETRVVGDQTVMSCWGREYLFEEDGCFPVQMTSGGKSILARPVELNCTTSQGKVEWQSARTGLSFHNANEAVHEGQAQSELGMLHWRRSLEFDGLVRWDLEIKPAEDAPEMNEFEIRIPMRADIARLWHIFPTLYDKTQTGKLPEGKGDLYKRFHVPYWWVGTIEAGLDGVCESDEAWPMAKHPRGFTMERASDGTVEIVYRFLEQPYQLKEPWSFTFALQATPVKEMPEDYRRWRMYPLPEPAFKMDWPHPDKNEYYGFPSPKNPEEYRENVKSWHDRDVAFVPYSLLNAISEDLPEWSYWGHEWFSGSVYYDTTDAGRFGGACLMRCLPVDEYIDFMVWSNHEFVKSMDLGGLYHDLSWAIPMTAPEKGYGYYRDGKAQSITPVLGVREIYKRMYIMLKDYGKKTGRRMFMVTHGSRPLMLPIIGFSDMYVDGEQFIDGLEDNYLDVVTLEDFYSDLMGHTYGMPCLFLPELTRRKDIQFDLSLATSRMVGLLILHDMLLWPSWCDREVLKREYSALGSTGYMKADFHPYWNNEDVVSGQSESVKCSVFTGADGGALLCIVNVSGEQQQAVLDLNCDKAGIGQEAAAKDVLIGEPVEWQEGQLPVTLEPYEPKYILLK